MLHSRERNALDRRHFNAYVWKAALATAGIEPSRANGMHALRRLYASVLLDAGETIKALSEYLGHSDPGFTLRTYTHLLPTSEQRTRQAVGSPRGYCSSYGLEHTHGAGTRLRRVSLVRRSADVVLNAPVVTADSTITIGG